MTLTLLDYPHQCFNFQTDMLAYQFIRVIAMTCLYVLKPIFGNFDFSCVKREKSSCILCHSDPKNHLYFCYCDLCRSYKQICSDHDVMLNLESLSVFEMKGIQYKMLCS